MATDLSDLVEAFKREVTIPGTFETTFPDTDDDAIAAALGDAFAEAQLDGFFGTMSLDVDAGLVDPDLSVAGAALVVMYAGMRMIRQQLRGLNTRTAYKAGPVEYEVEKAATALTEELKQLQARRNQILANAIRMGRGAGTVFMIDAYVTRAYSRNMYGGFYSHEVARSGLALGIG